MRVVLLLGFVLLAGCATTARTPTSTWDFGPLPAAAAGSAKLSGPILVLGVDAPAWLDSPAMLYRLAYAEAAEPRAYAASRWIAAPASLMTERLRGAIASSGAVVVGPGDGIRAQRTLRVELEEFDHTFDSPQSSHASMRLRATVIAGGALAGQRTFTISVPAPSNDARGAATALGDAANRCIAQVIAWLGSLPASLPAAKR